MKLPKAKKVKPVIGKEYEVQGKFAVLEAIEGNPPFQDGVFRDRWDNVFTCDMGYLQEKRK